MALNACELEIDLFCRGMRIPADVSLDGARGISRTRAGLGSGLEITIPTGTYWSGMHLYGQAATIDMNANALGALSSNGVDMLFNLN